MIQAAVSDVFECNRSAVCFMFKCLIEHVCVRYLLSSNAWWYWMWNRCPEVSHQCGSEQSQHLKWSWQLFNFMSLCLFSVRVFQLLNAAQRNSCIWFIRFYQRLMNQQEKDLKAEISCFQNKACKLINQSWYRLSQHRPLNAEINKLNTLWNTKIL